MADKEKIFGKDIRLFSSLPMEFPFYPDKPDKSSFIGDFWADNDGKAIDLPSVSGEANLRQAMLLRLISTRDALETLGHSNYGADIIGFLGDIHTPHMEGQIRQALEQDPRVRQATVQTKWQWPEQHQPQKPQVLKLDISICPPGNLAPLTWTIRFSQ